MAGAAMPDFTEPAAFSISAQGQELTFHPGGEERLEAILELIRGARSSLKLVFYIYAMDETGALVRDALAEAAGRGVAVSLILDAFGAAADDAFFAPLVAAGGRVLRFSPRWNVRYLIRNHQKLILADDGTAMIGGFNIEDAYFRSPAAYGWDDLGVTVEGSSVARLVKWFGELECWTAERNSQFFAIRRLVREWDPGERKVSWLVGGPTRWDSSWTRTLIRDLARARRFDLMTAYFAPHGGLVRRLGRIAERGRVRLLLPAKTDNAATLGAARVNYGRLLRAGVTIYEFEATKLHTKLIVVDDVVYVGSANFDMRSLYLNLELMLRIEDAALAERMRGLVAAHLAGSEQVTMEFHRKRWTLWNRIRWSLSWFLVTVVDYTVTRRLNLGL